VFRDVFSEQKLKLDMIIKENVCPFLKNFAWKGIGPTGWHILL